MIGSLSSPPLCNTLIINSNTISTSVCFHIFRVSPPSHSPETFGFPSLVCVVPVFEQCVGRLLLPSRHLDVRQQPLLVVPSVDLRFFSLPVGCPGSSSLLKWRCGGKAQSCSPSSFRPWHSRRWSSERFLAVAPVPGQLCPPSSVAGREGSRPDTLLPCWSCFCMISKSLQGCKLSAPKVLL